MESDDTVQRGGLVAMTLKRGMPHLAPVKCIKKALPTQSQHGGQMTYPHTAGSSASFQIYRFLFMSQLSSHTICHHEARHIICPLNSNIMHRAMVYGPENAKEHISENSTPLRSAAWPQGGISQAA